MKINGTHITNGFAEAFDMRATRLVVTAPNLEWAYIAAEQFCGFATSVIACGCEAAVEAEMKTTPDNRPGVSILLFARSGDEVAKQAVTRVGQCIMTSPGSALFSGLDDGKPFNLGRTLRYFGDGHQISKVVGGRRYRRVPVMDGEFLCEDKGFAVAAIGGGNFLIIGTSHAATLKAATAAVAAIKRRRLAVIMPFPGGMVRSGSKVGSRYPKLGASTNHRFCPTLKGVVDTALPAAAEAVIEIVINGLDAESIAEAMRVGIAACTELGVSGGILAIDAGDYGGKLGRHHFKLRKIVK